MSVEDRRKSPASDPGAEDDRPSSLPLTDEDESNERDALLALLLDETEPPEAVAPSEPHGIEHSAALDLRFSPQEVEIEVDDGEDEVPEAVEAEAPELPEVVPFEPPLSPPLLVPSVRLFSAEDETQVYAQAPEIAEPTPSTPQAAVEIEVAPEVESAPEIAIASAPVSESDVGLAELLEPEEDEENLFDEEPPASDAEIIVAAAEPEPPSPVIEATPRAPVLFPNERSAPQHLEESGRREAFLARASLIEAEARLAKDPAVTARGLLLAAELHALAGEDERARELGEAAKQASPSHPLSHRFSRAFALRDGDFAAFVAALDAEARVAKTPAARTHATLLAAEFARIQLRDDEGHASRLEQALRTSPSDLRAMLSLLADALAHDRPIPRLRFGETLSAAVRKLERHRGTTDEEQPIETALDALVAARDAYASRDRERLITALEALTEHEGLREAAAWLGAAVAAPSPDLRPKALAFLSICREGANAALAQRWTLARALELGDDELARETLTTAAPFTWSRSERLGLAALTGAGLDSVEADLDEALRDAELPALAAGLAAAITAPGEKGADALAPARKLARKLADRAPARGLRDLLDATVESHPAFEDAALRAELDLAEARLEAIAEGFAQKLAEGDPSLARDRALVAGLFQELAGRREAAHLEYERARQEDPGCEAAARAANETGAPAENESRLLELAKNLEDPVQAAFVFSEMAARSEDPQQRLAFVEEAHRRAPSLPFTAWIATEAAREAGDLEARLSWLARARDSASDPVGKAWLLVTEARLRANTEPDLAARLLEEASQAHPIDRALRELYERLSKEPPPDRATWLVERATEAEGEERARLALAAAFELEARGQNEAAARVAQMAVEAGETKLAPLCVERTAAGDGPGHQATLDEHPSQLPRLRKLEHQLIGEGRDDELEPIFSAIAEALSDPETTSHAMVAARLRQRKTPTASIRDLVAAASRIEEPSLWALRQLEAGARERGEDANAVPALDELAKRTTRPLERATLLLRAAEACIRLGDDVAARERLLQVLTLEPSHRVALELLAEVAERLGDHGSAAACYEKLAETSQVDAHRLDAWTRAAVLWLDQVNDAERGRSALQAAAAIDPGHGDVVDRLRALYLAQGDEAALANLLEQRLARATEPKERVRLEIERARLGARQGDLATAKASLLAALETSPDHLEALQTLAELCQTDEDWARAAWALERLAALSTQAEERADLHLRLGDLRRARLSDWAGAEAAYLEALSHRPGDLGIRGRLIDVYARSEQGAKALDLQRELLAAAATPDETKRHRLELARLEERFEADPSVAEATLDALRKQHPTDPDVLEAYVGFLQRTARDEAAQAFLDKAASDARRALSTGRFEPALFGLLATVAKLRDQQDAARVAEATLLALEGRAADLAGIGLDAASPELDDAIAPEPLTPAFRKLLARTGEALDAAVPFDLHAIRATPLPEEHAALGHEIRQLAAGFGLSVEILCSPALGHVCVPAQAFPPQLVLGVPLVTSTSAAVRRFLVLRALKVLSLRAAALARTAPVDLFPLVTAYLRTFVPDYAPAGADPAKVAAYAQKLAAALPKDLDLEVPRLAQKVVDALGNRASTLNTVVNAFGNRVALLATGDPISALSAIAWAGGNPNGPPPSGRDRITWVGRNAEARDLVVFSVSEAYARAREE